MRYLKTQQLSALRQARLRWRSATIGSLMAAAAAPGLAIEPTPPILFVDAAANAEFVPLAVDVAQVTDLELSAVVMQDGDTLADVKIDYDQVELRELDRFPVPEEKFHLEEQARFAAEDGKNDSGRRPENRPPRIPLDRLQIDRLRDLQVDRNAILEPLRGGVGVVRKPPADGQTPAKPVMFLIPARPDALREQKDGYYAVSYMATASWADDPSSKRIEVQHWGRYLVKGGEIRPLSLAEYSRLTDPLETALDSRGREVKVHAGRFGIEAVPLDQTEKFKAMPVEIEAGAEQADTGGADDREAGDDERNER